MLTGNHKIADVFEHYASLLELADANPFRVRAYRNAARVLHTYTQSVEEMLAEGKKLTEIPSIGDDLASKIREIVETGSFSDMQDIQRTLPEGLIQLETIPSLGPKRVKSLYEKLGVTDMASLLKACRAGKVAHLRGFGKKTETHILAACEDRYPMEVRFKIAVTDQIVLPLLAYIRKAPGVYDAVAAGSYRRRKETVGDLDILVFGAPYHSYIMNYVTAHEDIVRIIVHGETRATVRLRSGMQVDIRVIPQESYGAALVYFTGSKSHNIALRTMAVQRGIKINEYGVFKGEKRIGGRTEEEVYGLLGLPYIEPELRENQGEIEAAQEGRLPVLLTLSQVRGDLHAHTVATDGANTLEEMALAAQEMGYEYIAITDHTAHLTVAHGQDSAHLHRQCEAIDRLNENLKHITILKSAEVDILEDGTLDLPDAALRELDVVLCAVHSHFHLSEEAQTERIIRAMDNAHVNILAHPTGRLLNKRKPYAVAMEKVMRAAVERGCCLELNAFPDRLDMNDVHCRMAKELGVKVALSSDSHHISHLRNIRFGVAQARRGWLEAEDVINTRDLKSLRELLKRS